MIIIHGLIIFLIISSVESLKPLQEISQSQESALRILIDSILTASRTGPRRLNAQSLAKARQMYKKITKNMSKSQIKKFLREQAEEPEPIAVGKEQATLVEKELQNALGGAKPALLERPYVEKKGRNDFLVMQGDSGDDFVTVIPNAIYYNIEKKCVNWLDDCSLKGIRERLLRGVRSP